MNPRRGVNDSMNGVGISPKRDATMVSPHGSPPLPSISALNDKQQRRSRPGRKSPTGPVGHVSPGKSGRKEPRGTLGAATGRYGAALTEPAGKGDLPRASNMLEGKPSRYCSVMHVVHDARQEAAASGSSWAVRCLLCDSTMVTASSRAVVGCRTTRRSRMSTTSTTIPVGLC